MDCDTDYFINHYILIMYRLMLCLGDRAIIDDWIMIAQYRNAKDVLDKRNRLIAKGILKDDLAIVRYRSKART